MKGPVVELTTEEMDRLIQRLDTDTLRDDDLPTIKAIIKAYLLVTQVLQDKKTSIRKLLRMIFGAATEKAKTVLASGKTPGDECAKTGKDAGKKPCGHGRNGASAYTGAEKITVSHTTMKTGDMCPGCERGKVYPSVEPGMVVRITGGAPLKSRVWETEKLRCNLCGEVYTAPLPDEAGPEKYDETAGAMVPLLRYGSGLPFNRLEQLQESMGSPLPASTQWDIAEKASGRGPCVVYEELTRQAAQGHVIYNDDTTMKILSMINTHNKDERSGVFTTGMLSVIDDKRIVLFRTGRNHAGENMTNLLGQRDKTMAPPIQMCDALSRNTSKEFETILANCLTHARRNFVDVADSFPEECSYVIEKLTDVYKNDKTAKEENMTPLMRLRYHKAHSGPPMKELHKWMTDQLESRKAEPNSGLGKAISYMLKHWEPLTLFLRVRGAPLDNNLCERALEKSNPSQKTHSFIKPSAVHRSETSL